MPEASENIEPLLYWVHERESIRIKRAAGLEKPWSNDVILTTFRFCNVRRADDRVSTWLCQNVLTEENIKKAGLASFLMFSAWARWVNWPPTIKAVMDAKLWPRKQVDWKAVGKLVDQLAGKGKKKRKVWTGAFMIRAPKKSGAKKGKFIAEQVIGKHFKALVPQLTKVLSRPGATYQEVWAYLQTAENFGSFMAGQVAGDWTYTRLLRNASDLKTWAPMGPGSVRGFNRLMGLPKLGKKPPEELWLQKLGEWRTAVVRRMGPEYESITALDLQNALCETDKMLRVRQSQGRPRAKFVSHADQYEVA